jgi:hypothetical protein
MHACTNLKTALVTLFHPHQHKNRIYFMLQEKAFLHVVLSECGYYFYIFQVFQTAQHGTYNNTSKANSDDLHLYNTRAPC